MTSITSSSAVPLSATGELLADRMEEAARVRMRRRLRLAVAFTLIGMVAGLLYPSFRHQPYKASSRLQMFLRTPAQSKQGRLSKSGMTNQQELMLGRTFKQDVLDRLSPADQTRLAGGKIRPGKHEASQRADRASAALGGLEIEVEKGMPMMDISFASEDPRLATDVVTAAVAVAEDLGLRQRMQQTARVSQALGARLDELEQQILQAEHEEDEAQKRLGIARLSVAGAARAADADKLGLRPITRHALKMARRQGKTLAGGAEGVSTVHEDTAKDDVLLVQLGLALNRARLLARLETLRAATFETLHGRGQDDLVEGQARGAPRQALDRMRTELSREQAEIAPLTNNLGPNAPALRTAIAERDETERQIQRQDKLLVDSAQASARLARTRVAGLEQAFAQRSGEVGRQIAAVAEDQVPELSLEVDEALDAVQRDRLKGAQVTAGLQASGFYLVDRPSIPVLRKARPFKASFSLGTLAGMFVGLVISLVLYLRERMRWTLAEAEKVGGLSLVAVVPQSHRLRPQAGGGIDQTLETLSSPLGLYSSALDELRAKLLGLPLQTAAPVILFTSATPGEGKTTTAANLAVLLARAGQRVLLIDGDLHRPTLYKRFGLSGTRGLSQVLAGRAQVQELLQHVDGVPGLEILVAGPPVSGATQLLQSGAMADLLHHLRHSSGTGRRYILVDAPPVLGSTDSAYLAGFVDVLLFVVRYGRVDLNRVRGSRRLLRESAPHLSGMVVNGVPIEG